MTGVGTATATHKVIALLIINIIFISQLVVGFFMRPTALVLVRVAPVEGLVGAALALSLGASLHAPRCLGRIKHIVMCHALLCTRVIIGGAGAASEAVL